MARWIAAFGAVLGLFGCNVAAFANSAGGITILSGNYGKPGKAHRMDIAVRLQDLCGSQDSSCDIWCAQSTFGGRNMGKHALCRVIYRCPEGSTRSVEAAVDEPILMRCLARDGDAG